MRLAFPMWRKGFWKVSAPVVEEAMRRGHRVHLLWKRDEVKPGERVTLGDIGSMAWHRALVDHVFLDADAVIGDPSIGEMTDLPPGPRYALDFVWELRMRAQRQPGVKMCWTSEYQRSLFAVPMPILSCDPAIRVLTPPAYVGEPVTGMTALDAIPQVDPQEVRRKYNLGDKPILLFFALKFGGVRHFWRQTAYRWWHYARLIYALHDYAKRHGMTLVVKTRAKNHDPALLLNTADRVITDESLWPYTSAELCVAADLIVHFQSGAVFEAAAAGKPQLSIAVPQPHLSHFRGHDVFFSRAPFSLQNWPGVVQSCGYADAADLLHEDKVDRRPIGMAIEAYAERFLGPLDGKSASRVLDVVEARCR